MHGGLGFTPLKGEVSMYTVVILDNDSKWILSCKRMLMPYEQQMNCRFFQQPELAIEFITNNPVAVFVCNEDLPAVSGQEIFGMIEMLSPDTVKILMTQVKDLSNTLNVINQNKIFKLVLKPFFLVDDIAEPIFQALGYYETQQNSDLVNQDKKKKLEHLNQKIEEYAKKIEEKKQRYTSISNVTVGIIRGNMHSEVAKLNSEERDYVTTVCEELLQEFMHYYMFEERNYIFHMNYLKNLYHHPGKSCIFQIKNSTGHEIPQGIMEQIAYGIFMAGYYCEHIFSNYRAAIAIEEEETSYILRMFCQYNLDDESYKLKSDKLRRLINIMMEEISKSLSSRMVNSARENEFAAKLYYKKWE